MPDSSREYAVDFTIQSKRIVCEACTEVLRPGSGGFACCLEKKPGVFPTVYTTASTAGIAAYMVYDMHINIEPLSDVPYHLHIMPGPTSALHSTVESDKPVSVTTAGIPNELRLVARDLYDNQQVCMCVCV
jgi:hypothetical protein